MKFSLVRKRKAQLPSLDLPDSLMNDVGEIAQGFILDNIRKQRQADGSRIKVNAPSTRRKKQREGKKVLSLVDEQHRFVKGKRGSFTWEIRRKSSKSRKYLVIRPATSEISQLNRYVQAKGYTGWFGLSRKQLQAVRLVFRKWIRSEFAKKKRRR